MKTGQFILNSQIYAQRVPRGSTDAPEMQGSQGHRERLRITAPSENRVDILVLFPQRGLKGLPEVRFEFPLILIG